MKKEDTEINMKRNTKNERVEEITSLRKRRGTRRTKDRKKKGGLR
jgi:hypothetical protein